MVKIDNDTIKWLTLTIAFLALVSSIIAISLGECHYRELAKPHTLHDEVLDKLERLDDKIQETEQDIVDSRDSDIDTRLHEIEFSKALQQSEDADTAWRNGDYVEANELIESAYGTLDNLYGISPYIQGINQWLLSGIVFGIAVVVIALAVYLFWYKRILDR